MPGRLRSLAFLLCIPLLHAQHSVNEIERDRLLRQNFEAALKQDVETAKPYLSGVLDRPWLAEMDFRRTCALARALDDPETAAKLVSAVGLHNPELALRESEQYLPLFLGPRLFERFVLAAPDQAMGLASGTDKSARAFRERLSASRSPQIVLLSQLAGNDSIDFLRRERVAILSRPIANSSLPLESALKIASSTPRFFSAVLDLRTAASPTEALAYDRVLEHESLLLCQATQQNPNALLSGDLAALRSADLYTLLALGRAEATPRVFSAIFDRLLLPKWKRESGLIAWLDRTHDWELRDFTAGALAAGRFEALLALAGRDIVSRLSGGIASTADPLREAMRLSEIIDATSAPSHRQEMAAVVSAEFIRLRDARDLRGATLYGLLAAKLALTGIADPYMPFLRSADSLDTAVLYGQAADCIQRYFFYDDDDGVMSFHSFLAAYRDDPDWKVEDRTTYVHLTGRGPEGRRIEIYANVPIDGHLRENRAREGEAQRRQATITAVLDERNLVASVIVHRGHSFWVQKTLTYLSPSNLLVILGSCEGSTEVHAVLAASHDAQVIATRGVGTTDINDSLLKSLNDRILKGDRNLVWNVFWPELKSKWGRNAMFRDYVPPDQDPATVLLRAYYRYLDSIR